MLADGSQLLAADAMIHRLGRSLSRVEGWLLVLMAILILGAFLRLHNLGAESLWNDELESWRQSSFGSISAVLRKGVIPDTHPPAFQLILYGVENTLGSGEAALRLPSAVSGILSILIVYQIGKRFFGEPEALMAAAFLAVMWAPVRYSQEARNYALVMLAATIVSYFWMVLITRLRGDRRLGTGAVLGYIVAGAACAYTHYFGLLLVGLQAALLILLAWNKRRSLSSILAAHGAMGLLYLPWLPSMIEQSTHTSRISWIQPPSVTAFPAFFSFAFNRLPWLGGIALALLAWLVWQESRGAITGLRRNGLSSLATPDGLLLYWLIAPMAVAFLISLVWTPIFTQRNLLMCLPAVYLLLARAIAYLPIRRVGQAAIALGFVGVALYNLVFSLGYYRIPQKEQFREAVQYLIERYPATSDPPIVAYARFPEYFDYYFVRLGSELRVDLLAGEDGDVPRLRSFLETVDPDRIWFISAHRPPDEGFLQALQAQYVLLDQRSFIMAEVKFLAKAEE